MILVVSIIGGGLVHVIGRQLASSAKAAEEAKSTLHARQRLSKDPRKALVPLPSSHFKPCIPSRNQRLRQFAAPYSKFFSSFPQLFLLFSHPDSIILMINVFLHSRLIQSPGVLADKLNKIAATTKRKALKEGKDTPLLLSDWFYTSSPANNSSSLTTPISHQQGMHYDFFSHISPHARIASHGDGE